MYSSFLLIVLSNAFIAWAARTVGFTDTDPPVRILQGSRNPDFSCSPAYGHPSPSNCKNAAIKLGDALGGSRSLNLINVAPERYIEPTEYKFGDVHQRHPWAKPFAVPLAFKVGDCYAVLNIAEDLWTAPTDLSNLWDIMLATRPIIHECLLSIGMGGVQRTGEENKLAVSFYGTDSDLDEARMLNKWCKVTEASGRCNLPMNQPAAGSGSMDSSGSTEVISKVCDGWANRGSDCCQGSTFKDTAFSAPLRALMLGIKQVIAAGPSESIGWCSSIGS